MIKLMRLDERFIHGQVAFVWVNSLNVNCIFIANDRIADNSLEQTTLKLAVPPGVRFVAKNIEDSKRILCGEKIKKYKVLLIVNSTKDALELIQAVNEIKQLNLGNSKFVEGKKMITNSLALSMEDISKIREIEKMGIEVECRAIPTDKKQYILDLI